MYEKESFLGHASKKNTEDLRIVDQQPGATSQDASTTPARRIPRSSKGEKNQSKIIDVHGRMLCPRHNGQQECGSKDIVGSGHTTVSNRSTELNPNTAEYLQSCANSTRRFIEQTFGFVVKKHIFHDGANNGLVLLGFFNHLKL